MEIVIVIVSSVVVPLAMVASLVVVYHKVAHSKADSERLIDTLEKLVLLKSETIKELKTKLFN